MQGFPDLNRIIDETGINQSLIVEKGQGKCNESEKSNPGACGSARSFADAVCSKRARPSWGRAS